MERVIDPTEDSAGSSTGQGRRAVGRWIVVASGVIIAVATLSPVRKTAELGHFCFFCTTLGTVDATLNVLLFAPLGFGLSLAGVRARRSLGLMIGCTFLIELLQLVAIPGRNASLEDILANSVGGALGFFVARNLDRLTLPGRRAAARLCVGSLGVWLLLQSLFAYSFTENMPEPPYYGQLLIFPEETVVFPGTVMSAAVDSEPVVDGDLRNASPIRQLLARPAGAPIHVRAIPTGAPRTNASMFRIGGTNDRDIVSMEQDGRDVTFELRTGADASLLRAYSFRLRDVFDDRVTKPETVSIHARYARNVVTLGATGAGRDRERTFVPRLSAGWRLFMPIQTSITTEAIDGITSAAFLIVLLLPAGYWAHFATAADTAAARRRRLLLGVGLVSTALALGLAVIPLAFGLRAASPLELVSAVAGIVLGGVLARIAAHARQRVAGSRR